MKIIAVMLIMGAINIMSEEGAVIIPLAYISLAVFLLKKYKHQRWLPKRRISERKRIKQLENAKINELNERSAYRKFNISGVTHDGRQRKLHHIMRKYGSEGMGRIKFVPDPENEYDSNALEIVFEDIGILGYVPKDRAADIANTLNRRPYEVKWNIQSFDNERDKEITYMEIRLY